jgi:lipoprotein-releasing system permease protein
MKLPFQIALRFLKSGKLQTLMIVVGIAVGVSVQVFIGSLITGLQRSLVDRTIGSSSQITIKAEDDGYLADYETILSQIEADIPDIEAASATISTPGTLVLDASTQPTLLRGFDFETADAIYGFSDKLAEGRLPEADNETTVGILLLQELGASVGDTVDLQIPLVGTFEVTIVGTFDFNVQAINQSWALTTRSTVQTFLNVGDVVQAVEMQITDVFEAETVTLSIQTLLDDDALAYSNWIEQNAELLSGLQGQSISSLMIQIFVMVSVVLAIASVLAITVLQKSKQIGILKAMGIQDQDASLVFLFEGLILGIFGAIGGVLLGLGLSYAFTTFALGPDGNPVVPLYIDFSFIALSALIATLAATLAALIPARKSSRLSVIEVIRNA